MKSNRFAFLLALLACLLVGPATAVADEFIWLDVSVKFVVDPATGLPPAGTDDANLRQVFDLMNRWLANTWRGFRVRLVDLDASQDFQRIGGVNDTTGPSKWYDTDLKNDATANANFEAAAKADSALYAWNYSAMNLYINNGDFSYCAFPSEGRDLVISSYQLISSNVAPEFYLTENYKVAGNLLHEIGHFFELYHTFNDSGDDGIADTARDNQAGLRDETAIRNGLAQFNWSMDYAALTLARQTLVDNTANNAMSYYQLFYDDPAQNKTLTDAERFGPTRFLFTEQQMDKWTDNANAARLEVTSGRTCFVSTMGIDSGVGTSSTAPLRTVAYAVGVATTAQDIVLLLLRPGAYNETLTISQPVTLRATRAGSVTIGAP